MLNNGPNGLPRLDKVVELAERYGIYLLLTLTNNWNPSSGVGGNDSTSKAFNRNYLCNDYGQCVIFLIICRASSNLNRGYGYVRTSIGSRLPSRRILSERDNHGIIQKLHYQDCISLYQQFGRIRVGISQWSTVCGFVSFFIYLANTSHRCSSSLPSGHCTPQTVTKWHATLAKHVASVDPNHIIGSGWVSADLYHNYVH